MAVSRSQDGVHTGSHRAALWALAVVYALGVVAAYAFYVRSGVGQRLDEAGFLGREGARRSPVGDAESILGGIELTVLAAVLIGLGLAAYWRGRADLAAVVLAVVVGANLTTQLLKFSVFERPHLIPDSFRLANSYPSGHVTAVASLAMAAVLVVPRRWRPAVAAPAVAVTFIVGLSTVAAGWHRPGDVIGAWLVVGLWAALALGTLVALGGGGGSRPVTRVSAMFEAALWITAGAAAVTFLTTSAAWAALHAAGPDATTAQSGLAQAAAAAGMLAAGLLVVVSIVSAIRRHTLAPEWLRRS